MARRTTATAGGSTDRRTSLEPSTQGWFLHIFCSESGIFSEFRSEQSIGFFLPCLILILQYCRGYYRCTYQKSQGCAATKQVQRADEDPSLYDVIYNAEHTCVHKATAAAAAKAQPGDARSLLQSLSSSLKVETEGLTPKAQQQGWGATTPPFSLSSPAVSGLTPLTPENCFAQGVSAPTSLEPSPATSGSNHLSMRAQCEFDTMVSALMTATSMPPPLAMEETAFSLDGIDFDEFDVSCFFAPDC
uniref:Uncharacterized protein n=1 Tax=Avena sativa TaxID=4498 RepID=A0ACD5YG19_AVESA